MAQGVFLHRGTCMTVEQGSQVWQVCSMGSALCFVVIDAVSCVGHGAAIRPTGGPMAHVPLGRKIPGMSELWPHQERGWVVGWVSGCRKGGFVLSVWP